MPKYVIEREIPGAGKMTEAELREVGHALRIQDAIRVIALMLHDTCVEAPGAAIDAPAVRILSAISNVARTLDPAPQAR